MDGLKEDDNQGDAIHKCNENESGLKTEIQIEELDLENGFSSAAIDTPNDTTNNDQNNKNEPPIVTIIETESEICDTSKIDDKNSTRVEEQNDVCDKASQNVNQLEMIRLNPSSVANKKHNSHEMLQRTESPDINEPVAKKRRIAASEFLELSEPNSSDISIEYIKVTTKIPQPTTGNIKTYTWPMQQGVPLNDIGTDPCLIEELYEESGINSWKSAYDITLPPNLLEMCRPNKCDLCDVSFTKPIVGKTHYAGKSHVGNTEKYLANWCMIHKERKPERLREFNEDIPDGMKEEWCPVCQLTLSSKIVAISHYKGQKHQKACRRKAETGSEVQIHDNANAILSPSERDQRSPKRNESGHIYQESKTLADELTSSSAHLNSNVEDDEEGELVIVEEESESDFKIENAKNKHSQTPEHEAKVNTDSSATIDKFLSSIRREPDKPKGNVFWCNYCTLQCSSQIDFDTHCSGKSHAKKLKVHQVLGIEMNRTSFPTDTINVADISQALNPTTYRKNATYRCDVCQIVTTDQGGLDMHLLGKKHKKKLEAMKWVKVS